MSEESLRLLSIGLCPHQQAQQGGSAPPWAALTSLSPTSSRTLPDSPLGIHPMLCSSSKLGMEGPWERAAGEEVLCSE